MPSEPLTVTTGDGRSLDVYDAGPAGAPALFWHHGSPHTGALLPPVVDPAATRGMRVVTYARPGYGGSTPQPGRRIGDAVADVAAIADALGLDTFATMGASGGGPHAVACAAGLPDRVRAVVTFSGPAPYTEDFDWYAGMADDRALRAATHGRQARVEYEADAEFDPGVFSPADWAALDGELRAVGQDAGKADQSGGGLVDDDVALAQAWGVDLAAATAPMLLVHGGLDRWIPAAHAQWLVGQLPAAELWLRPHDGHVSVMTGIPTALDWLRNLA